MASVGLYRFDGSSSRAAAWYIASDAGLLTRRTALTPLNTPYHRACSASGERAETCGPRQRGSVSAADRHVHTQPLARLRLCRRRRRFLAVGESASSIADHGIGIVQLKNTSPHATPHDLAPPRTTRRGRDPGTMLRGTGAMTTMTFLVASIYAIWGTSSSD